MADSVASWHTHKAAQRFAAVSLTLQAVVGANLKRAARALAPTPRVALHTSTNTAADPSANATTDAGDGRQTPVSRRGHGRVYSAPA